MGTYKIVVLAHYPVKAEDGMNIRIKAIDTFFEGIKRCYIASTIHSLDTFLYFFIKDLKRKSFLKNYKSFDVTTLKYIPINKLNSILKQADIIYIQTGVGLLELPETLMKKYADKIYFDLHGCFVEEATYLNRSKIIINELAKYERIAFHNLKNFICVSDNMIDFYKNKYPLTCNANYINLPIFSLNKESNIEKVPHNKINIIYAGGQGKWQNVQEMLNTISQITNNIQYDIKFYTYDVDYFKNEFKKHNIKNIEILHKTPKEMISEYRYADFGFILRDDSIVNRVACPTKLIEYMENGVIPIVLQPEIGDFNKLGYKYILNSDLIAGKIPNKETLDEMRKINRKIILDYNIKVSATKEELINAIKITNN